MNSKEFHINSVEQLSEVSDYLISLRDEADIIAFYGAMGAGKTTLIKNLCHRMGVTDEVNSPTFAIVNEWRESLSIILISIALRSWRKPTTSAMRTISTAATYALSSGPR